MVGHEMDDAAIAALRQHGGEAARCGKVGLHMLDVVALLVEQQEAERADGVLIDAAAAGMLQLVGRYVDLKTDHYLF